MDLIGGRAVPPLAERSADLDRIIAEHAVDAIAELAAPAASFTADDQVWVRNHAALDGALDGPVEAVPLNGGVLLWCSQGGLWPRPGLPLNRCLPTDPRLPSGFKDADPARLAADPHGCTCTASSSSPGAHQLGARGDHARAVRGC